MRSAPSSGSETATRPTTRWCAVAAAVAATLLGGCGSDVGRVDPTATGVDHTAPEGPPHAPPDSPTQPIDPGPVPPVCGTFDDAGQGTTWVASSPASAVQRPLRCLDPASDGLAGRFVSRTAETPAPEFSGTPATEADRIYDYAVTDPQANQPAAYYVVTEMALSLNVLDAELAAPAVALATGPFFLANSYYSPEHGVTLGRGGLPGGRLDVEMAAHEYGHHAVTTLAPGLSLSTLHEGMADFLACHQSKDPDLMATLPAALRRPCENARRWPDDAQNVQQACALLVQAFQQAGWSKSYESEYEAALDCAAMPPPWALEGHQTGMIVSGALWSLHESLGVGTFMPLFFRALTLLPKEPTGDFGMLRAALHAADEALFGGANTAALDAELAYRGMLSDVGLGDQELEGGTAYACLETAEHRAADRLPAGPIMAMARNRR